MNKLREILNYPLLRGEAAERWSRPLVQWPMAVLAVAAPLVVASAVMGAGPTTFLALFSATQLGGAIGRVNIAIGESMKARRKALKRKAAGKEEPEAAPFTYKQVPMPQAMRAAEQFTAFAYGLPPAKQNVNLSFAVPSEIVGVPSPAVMLRADARQDAEAVLDYSLIAAKTRSEKQALRIGESILAHEMGHLHGIHINAMRAQHYGAVLASNMRVGCFVAASAAFIVGAPLALLASVGALPAALAGAQALAASVFFGGVLGYYAGHSLQFAGKLMNGIASRQEELQADRFAIRHTRDVRSFTVAQIRFDPDLQRAKRNTAPTQMMRLLATHPTGQERIREAFFYNRQLKAKAKAAAPAEPR